MEYERISEKNHCSDNYSCVSPILIKFSFLFVVSVVGLILFTALFSPVSASPLRQGTVDIQISSGADDAHELDNNTSFSHSSTALRVEANTSPSSRYNACLRFPGVNIPQGSVIDSAYVSVVFPASTRDSPRLTFYAYAADDAADFSMLGDCTGLSVTSASVAWSGDDLGSGSPVNGPSLVSVVQEIINRPGWSSGNALVIIAQGDSDENSDTRFTAYDNVPGDASAIHIEWSVPGTPTPGPTATPQADLILSAGTIMLWSSPTVPNGWLLCDGSEVSRSAYAELYNEVGTLYGDGNGSTTFNLPDFRSRFPIGQSASYSLGSTGGSTTVEQDDINQLAVHGHFTPGFLLYYCPGGTCTHNWTASSGGNLQLGVMDSGGELVSSVGSAAAMDIVNPYLATRYIIAAESVLAPTLDITDQLDTIIGQLDILIENSEAISGFLAVGLVITETLPYSKTLYYVETTAGTYYLRGDGYFSVGEAMISALLLFVVVMVGFRMFFNAWRGNSA